MDEKGQLDLHISRHSRVLEAGGKYVILCNIESTLPSATTPFDETDFVSTGTGALPCLEQTEGGSAAMLG
jgi:hypothetical protein